MPQFEYVAQTPQGDEQTGTIDLPTKEDVAAHLRKKRMRVVRVREAKSKKKKGGRVPTRDVVVFTRQFATMINSGLHVHLVHAERVLVG